MLTQTPSPLTTRRLSRHPITACTVPKTSHSVPPSHQPEMRTLTTCQIPPSWGRIASTNPMMCTSPHQAFCLKFQTRVQYVALGLVRLTAREIGCPAPMRAYERKKCEWIVWWLSVAWSAQIAQPTSPLRITIRLPRNALLLCGEKRSTRRILMQRPLLAMAA